MLNHLRSPGPGQIPASQPESPLYFRRLSSTSISLALLIRLHSHHLRPNPRALKSRRHPLRRPHLVEARRPLRDLPAQLPGHQRRRHRRPQRHHPAPRLPPVPRRRRHLDRPHVPLAAGRLRLRHLQLHRPSIRNTAPSPTSTACSPTPRSATSASLLDMVLNHTSDKHPWFIDSASSRTNPQADWYIWNDGKPTTDPKAPNAHQGPKGWVVRPTTGRRSSRARRGSGSPPATSSTITSSTSSSPTSTGATPPSKKPCSTPCASGSTAASPASVSTPSPPSSKTPPSTTSRSPASSTPSGFPESNHTLTSGLPEVHDVLRRMRTMIDRYPDNRVLVGEIYRPQHRRAAPVVRHPRPP